jgi:hypothetical protein
MVETVQRKVTPKHTIKVDFEVVFCFIHFYKFIQQSRPNSFLYMIFIEGFSHVQLDDLVFVEKKIHQEAISIVVLV